MPQSQIPPFEKINKNKNTQPLRPYSKKKKGPAAAKKGETHHVGLSHGLLQRDLAILARLAQLCQLLPLLVEFVLSIGHLCVYVCVCVSLMHVPSRSVEAAASRQAGEPKKDTREREEAKADKLCWLGN